MRIFILANGDAKRWGNYLGVDKPLIQIDGETLLSRTVRLLKENGLNDIVIVGKFEVEGAKNYIPDFESKIAKFDIIKNVVDDVDNFALLYGDCYYSDAIIKDLATRKTDKEWLHWCCNRYNRYTGKLWEEGYIHAVYDKKWWFNKCEEYQRLLSEGLEHKLDWMVIRYMTGIDLNIHQPHLMKYYEVDWEDETDDFDYSTDYDRWMKNVKGVGKKLSIIIPYYKTYALTQRLLGVLKPQLNEEVEVLIVNNSDTTNFDSLYTHTLYCESNGTASKPRNIGLDKAKGKYVAFIDSDDLITSNYIEKILNKINTSEFDHCFISWKYLNSGEEVIITDYPPESNYSVWNCIYKREIIGNIRFDENLKIAEDYEFNKLVRIGKKENIKDILYFYNEGRVGSIMNNL